MEVSDGRGLWLLTTFGQCLLNLVVTLWLHKAGVSCSWVAVVAVEGTSAVLAQRAGRRLSCHLPFSSVEESSSFHWWCGLLLCFPNITRTCLPCLVALGSGCTAKWWTRTWKCLHVAQMQSGTCTCKDGPGVTCRYNCLGVLHEHVRVSQT